MWFSCLGQFAINHFVPCVLLYAILSRISYGNAGSLPLVPCYGNDSFLTDFTVAIETGSYTYGVFSGTFVRRGVPAAGVRRVVPAAGVRRVVPAAGVRRVVPAAGVRRVVPAA